MCILVFYVNPNPKPNEFYLILINVRDEIYDRPTQIASFWESNSDIISSVDMEPGKEGGTWLAMNKNGRIGALLNILQPDNQILPDKKGRGFLAVDFVKSCDDPFTYLKHVGETRKDYNGFLLVALDLRVQHQPYLAYVSNSSIDSTDNPVVLEPGIYTFGNSVVPCMPWPKVQKAKEHFSNVVKKHGFVEDKESLVKELFDVLNDKTIYGLDENLKSQGKGKPMTFLKKLSAIFVDIPQSNYGSRSHTVILIDSSETVDYYESNREVSANGEWKCHHHSFKLKTKE